MKELQSLSQIFHQRLFRIPDYQRGYAWLEKPHLQDFWEDLINLQDKRAHYTGVLSLKEVSRDVWSHKDQWKEDRWVVEDREYTPYYIVDGQQRLTTAAILLASLIELVKNLIENKEKKSDEIRLGGYTLKSIEEQYVSIIQPGENVIRTYIFGYESDNPSFKFLRHRIFGEPYGGVIEETFYTQNLANAYRFFQRNLTRYYNDYGFKGIEDIFKGLTNRLKFNLYEISDDFDVFVAFETMNNRGKQLSNLEKLKNRLIYLTTLYGENEVKENERQKVRDNINEAWKSVYHQLGRDKDYTLPDDEYLRAHWIVYFKYSRKKGDDYIKYLLNDKFTTHNVFQKKAIVNLEAAVQEVTWNESEDEEILTENGVEEISEPLVRANLSLSEINDYVKKLGESAIYWHATFFPFENRDEHITSEEKTWLDKLNRISMGYFRPLVMATLSNRAITPMKRVELFKAIERFVFLTMLLGKQYSNYRSSTYFNFSRDVYLDSSKVDDIITSLQNDLWPVVEYRDGKPILKVSDFKSLLSKKFDPRNVEGFYTWNGLRYFLFEYEIECGLKRQAPKVTWKSLTSYEKDKVSIEHIYPQSASADCWMQNFGNYNDFQRSCLGGSLGNLLLLSKSINSSLQNDCYASKKEVKHDSSGNSIRSGYKEGSYSELQLVNRWADWTPESIRERGLDLLDFMEKRWEFKFPSEADKLALLHLDFLE